MAKSQRRIPTLPKRIERDRPMFYGAPDPIALNQMAAIVTNLRTLQEERFSRSTQADPRRDLDDECGYPKHEWSAEEYHDLIMNEPVAAIVNSIYPIESWQVSPSLYEEEDAESKTVFEEEWDNLSSLLSPEPSYHLEETGARIWSTCLTADILAGECRYGIILIGLKDGKELSEPATPRKDQEITFLRAFPEYLARVNAFEYDKKSPRYGQPISYAIQFSDPRDSGDTGLNEPNITEYVHWSRVVHITDLWHTASPSAIFAVPRIKPVRNPLLDVRKVRGSSAEMYYKGAFGGHHFGTHPQLGADVDVDADAMKDAYEEYINGLQRAIFTSGMSVDPLAPQVVDPTPQILCHIEAIAMKIRCPKRKLIGNETGERASDDDAKQWAGILSSRNNRQTTPNLIVPLVNRLVNLGCLSRPRVGYRISWPELYSMSDSERATILLQRTQAYGAYVAGGIEAIVPPLDYMTKFDSMEEEEAEAILEAAEAAQEEKLAEDAALADEHNMIPEVEGFQHPPPDPIEVAKETAKVKASVTKNIEDTRMEWDPINNKFCATGKGGGIDPTCTSAGHSKAKRMAAHIEATKRQPDSALDHTTPNGEWSEKRKKLHAKIVKEVFSGATPVDKPISYIMGGGPAAGKSTIIAALDIPKNIVSVAPDDVKAKLPEYKNMVKKKDPNAGNFVHRESGHISDLIQEKGSNGKYHTLVDGTADTNVDSLGEYLGKMRAAGQKIVANYVTVDTEVAVARAFQRGQETGRFVPEAAIRAIHRNVSLIVPEAIKRGIYDEFTLWDTGVSGKPVKVAEAKGKELIVHDRMRWDKFVAKGTE